MALFISVEKIYMEYFYWLDEKLEYAEKRNDRIRIRILRKAINELFEHREGVKEYVKRYS